MNAIVRETPVAQLVRARAVVAELMLIDPIYAPIFERLDDEHARAVAAADADPVTRARQMIETMKAEASDVTEQP